MECNYNCSDILRMVVVAAAVHYRQEIVVVAAVKDIVVQLVDIADWLTLVD